MTKPKQSYKKHKSNTKRRKTSTVPKGIAATRELLGKNGANLGKDDPEIHRTPKPYDTKFLVVVIINAMPVEIMFAGASGEAVNLAKQILHDYRNGKNLHVSIWEWTEDRYLKRKGFVS